MDIWGGRQGKDKDTERDQILYILVDPAAINSKFWIRVQDLEVIFASHKFPDTKQNPEDFQA